ncbi:MAG: transcription antitermination factor NusB [Candidatus Bipolaricaulota bacterium]|nr:transcription antitermination factor NusB [Candidatus Bipolaricaulota bacterium]MCX7844659.1 transcription antitermination factor NusB [Candidatus Bipolaricaulota bacterium]MDW8151314.1 transcription antitermination factor NusB [Candidatus Bipolaricaulota bacterium]
MRRKAREAVLRCLYRWEFLPLPPEELLAEVDLPKEAREFAHALLAGVLAQRDKIDPIIDARAHGWGLDRLPLVDRNILRLGLYELLFTDTPPEVVIDEAVELAKAYGTARAPAVVNAILDRVWKEGVRGTLG